jgi:hypothetical protein
MELRKVIKFPVRRVQLYTNFWDSEYYSKESVQVLLVKFELNKATNRSC